MLKKYDWIRIVMLLVGIVLNFWGTQAGGGDIVVKVSIPLLIIGLVWSGFVLGEHRKKKEN